MSLRASLEAVELSAGSCYRNEIYMLVDNLDYHLRDKIFMSRTNPAVASIK